MQKVLQYPTVSGNHKERLQRLSEKISDVRLYTEQEKSTRIGSIEQTLEFIEDNLFECQEAFTKALKGLEGNIAGLQEEVDEDIREADSQVSNDIQDLLKFEQKLQNTYESICQRRKEHEFSISQFLDEQVLGISEEIKTENALMQEGVKQLTQIYQSDFKKLKSGLAQVQADREAEDEKIQNYMHTNLTKVSDDINDLQKASESAEKTIFNNIKSAVVNTKSVIDAEKRQRETTHEQMIKLLEDSYKGFRSHDD